MTSTNISMLLVLLRYYSNLLNLYNVTELFRAYTGRESVQVKGATSRITQLEKAGKFFPVCHS